MTAKKPPTCLNCGQREAFWQQPVRPDPDLPPTSIKMCTPCAKSYPLKAKPLRERDW